MMIRLASRIIITNNIQKEDMNYDDGTETF